MSMSIVKPRLGRIRTFAGTDTSENDSSRRYLIGYTAYNHEQTSGRETYEVNYLEFGGRSDGLTNVVQMLQENMLLVM